MNSTQICNWGSVVYFIFFRFLLFKLKTMLLPLPPNVKDLWAKGACGSQEAKSVEAISFKVLYLNMAKMASKAC